MAHDMSALAARLEEAMPSLSPTATKVMQLARDINCPPGELTRVIKLDPVLSAKVLRLVNSSYFAIPKKVVSLEKAVIMLGLNTIKNLAITAAALAQMENSGDDIAFDIDGFWKHSLGVGVTGKIIALKRGVPRQTCEDYFVAGLLHDLGLFVENSLFPEEMKRVLLTSRALGLLEVESAELDGLDHAVLGKLLAEKWNLSEDLTAVMEQHHAPDPGSEHAPLVQTISLANIICKNHDIGLVLDDTPIEVPDDLYAAAGITRDFEEQLVGVLDREIKKAMEFLTQ